MNSFFQLLQIPICVLEAYLIIYFFSAFFSVRSCFKFRYTLPGLMLATAVYVYAVNYLDNPTINIVAMFIVYFAIIIIFFHGKVLKKFLCYITAMIIMTGSEFIFVIIMSLPTDFSINKIESDQMKFTILIIGVKLLEVVLFNIIKRISGGFRKSRSDLKITLQYSIIPISLIGIMVAIARLSIDFSNSKYTQALLTICCGLALVGCVLLFSVFDKYTQSIECLQQQEMMIMQLEMEGKHYEQVEQINKEYAAFLHDIRHYMAAIGEMAVDGENDEILQILSELQIKISDTESEIYCTNCLLNAVLNEKKKDAERKNVAVKIVVEPDFITNHVANTDLVVIVSNLFDNAVEAAAKCSQGQITVSMFMRNEGHFSVIKIVNNYVGEIIPEGDWLLTDKADRAKHGFGMRNAGSMAVRYGGYLKFFYEDGVFTAIVILPRVDYPGSK